MAAASDHRCRQGTGCMLGGASKVGAWFALIRRILCGRCFRCKSAHPLVEVKALACQKLHAACLQEAMPDNAIVYKVLATALRLAAEVTFQQEKQVARRTWHRKRASNPSAGRGKTQKLNVRATYWLRASSHWNADSPTCVSWKVWADSTICAQNQI